MPGTGASGAQALKDALAAVTAVTTDPAAVASDCAGEIAAAGDLLWPVPGGKPSPAARVTSAVATGLSLLAACPGGVSFAGQHWCTAPHPRCPGPGRHDGSADAGKAAGAVHTPLWLASAVTAPALDALVYRPGPLSARPREAWRSVPSNRILGLRVADIACGSGAFLLPAWAYLTAALITAWRDEGDPRASDPCAAGRAVAARCLYGADISPAPVALSRLSLQLAAYQPAVPVPEAGKFATGDSLLGDGITAAFPEVVAAGGFDAVIGNPPFLGGRKITGQLGPAYRERLVAEIARGRRGSADLSAYFLLRAWDLTAPHGAVAVLATSTLAEGATREVGLDQVCAEGGEIMWAVKREPWPDGRAAVQYCAAVIAKGPVEPGAPRHLARAAAGPATAARHSAG
jgi:hypothetical protein